MGEIARDISGHQKNSDFSGTARDKKCPYVPGKESTLLKTRGEGK